ncbi:MAG TPA: NADH-quinone oxidoreductase subunit J [Thermoleophilaceae bacterium]
MREVLFFVAALGAIGGALGVVLLRNPFYSVLALVGHLVALALLFLLLNAEFLAAAQLVVYAGAVMVLYVFVVAYIGGVDDPGFDTPSALTRIAPLFALLILIELTIAVTGSGLQALDSGGAEVGAGFGSPREVGELLLEKFLVPFEAASFLLLVAAVGAIVLARRRRGLLDEADELPERAGKAPIGGDGTGHRGVEYDAHAPAGTAEGAGDPTPARGDDRGEASPEPREPAPEEPAPDEPEPVEAR